MSYTPRLGSILMFNGDKRKVQSVIKNVSSFSSVSHALKQGDSDVTSSYISDSADKSGNLLISATIGGFASIPAGNYRYFITGIHSGKTTTFYWDVIVLAKDISQIEVIPDGDYNPFLDEITMYEGDARNLAGTIPSLDMVSATGVFKLDDTDKTSTYCNSSVSVSADTVTTHVIGGLASIPAATYGYFVSIAHSNSEAVTTYFWKINVVAKNSII